MQEGGCGSKVIQEESRKERRIDEDEENDEREMMMMDERMTNCTLHTHENIQQRTIEN